ncbi:MAG TPA: type ISP restriction/modification enzyme [Ktedonobacterales bacterium]|nr:type ISP restriction/modification enzyme [Ktedonobacterales bacterium]
MKPQTLRKTALDDYYRHLKELQGKAVTNEEGLRPAFQGLLISLGREQGWTLVPEVRLANGSRPDGTFVDANTLHRGFWEAKDTKDDLETEIKKKIARGYPLTNTIFEDTQHAVLFQQGKRVLDVADLTQPQWLTDLLTQFFSYTEPAIAEFEQAVEEFQGRIPDLAKGLLALIAQERGANKRFQQAFGAFHTLCQSALNPHISVAAIEEMLVQHLLTERLFRTIFDDSDFTNRNVIAREIEQVIQALTSRAFNRTEFLKGLDRFYKAIEEAARTISDWTEKQHFLNTVYERFFQGYSVKQADTLGIVYTPQEIVDFMVVSVEEVLRQEFGKDLSSPGVQILDPCTGTGNFIVNILRRISLSALEQKYTQDLFANEIMLLAYYIASLNIEHAYYERAGHYLSFDGLCFVDTLELAESQQMSMFVEANTERVEREKAAEITVIIGNPPYNVGQMSENDNNKNRAYPVVDKRISDTYSKGSKATNTKALADAYVKFFRWATDRLGKRDGIVCLVSNNSFIHKFAFDGMRKHLLQDFSQVYHFDFKGDAHTTGDRRRSEGGNIFDDKIRVGVGITILVRSHSKTEPRVFYHCVGDAWSAAQKKAHLSSFKTMSEVPWQPLIIDTQSNWLTGSLPADFATFLALGSREGKAARDTRAGGVEVETIFKVYSRGAETTRDSWMYDFAAGRLAEKASRMIETYNAELSRWMRAGAPPNIDDFVLADETKIKWSSRLKECFARRIEANFAPAATRNALYRPFTRQWLYFDSVMTHRQGLLPIIFPTSASEAENISLVVSDLGYRSPFSTLVTNMIPDLHLLAGSDAFQCFPFYIYAEDGSNRRENITDWALSQFQAHYGEEVSKRDIFHYVYALLHHPTYRERYAENLKRELPRIPLLADREAFAALVQTGVRLKDLHLGYEEVAPYPLRAIENPKASAADLYRVTKMRLTPERSAVIINDALTLADIPPEVSHYRLGNRSALEWVLDQYQVSTDSRSGITSDPNREDDPEYIVRLLKQVVTVSLETVQIVAALPALTIFPPD